jgi:hypothetical protein
MAGGDVAGDATLGTGSNGWVTGIAPGWVDKDIEAEAEEVANCLGNSQDHTCLDSDRCTMRQKKNEDKPKPDKSELENKIATDR